MWPNSRHLCLKSTSLLRLNDPQATNIKTLGRSLSYANGHYRPCMRQPMVSLVTTVCIACVYIHSNKNARQTKKILHTGSVAFVVGTILLTTGSAQCTKSDHPGSPFSNVLWCPTIKLCFHPIHIWNIRCQVKNPKHKRNSPLPPRQTSYKHRTDSKLLCICGHYAVDVKMSSRVGAKPKPSLDNSNKTKAIPFLYAFGTPAFPSTTKNSYSF